MICDEHKKEYKLSRLSEGGTGIVCSVCDDQERIRALEAEVKEVNASWGDALERLKEARAEVERLTELGDAFFNDAARLRVEVERLRGHLAFFGAKEMPNGDLEVDMPKYHKAHKEPGYDELKSQCDALRDGLKRLEWCNSGWANVPDGVMAADDCPICGGGKQTGGHEPDCWLAALLKESPCPKP